MEEHKGYNYTIAKVGYHITVAEEAVAYNAQKKVS